MKVGVVGSGHVGMVVAACLAEVGYDVIGVDLPSVVEALNRGEIDFFEPGLGEKVAKNVKAGRLRASTRLADLANVNVVWICVGTSQTAEGAIHFDLVERIVNELGRLCTSCTIIAIKSTMPVGACRYLAERLPTEGPILVSNPEFLRQGSAIHDFFSPGKTVVGTGPQGGVGVLAQIYSILPGTFIHTNWETAETIKLTQNTFNALHISFLNELSLVTDGLNISLDQVSQALREDEHALKRYLHPGFSYGGSCLPSNVAYLSYLARTQGYDAPLIQSIATVNDLRISLLVEKISQTLGNLQGRFITIWGFTYKANTDDLRDSPSMRLAQKLFEAGAQVQIFDPILQLAKIELVNVYYTFFETAQQSLHKVDTLVTLTKCAEFASVPATAITKALSSERILDLVGALPQLTDV